MLSPLPNGVNNTIHLVVLDLTGIDVAIDLEGYFPRSEAIKLQEYYYNASEWRVVILNEY